MSDETEVLFDSRQVAEVLGVGSAMLRRYASVLEELSGEELPLHRRFGRQFTRAQIEVLKGTRDMVQRRGLSVEVAMREALGLTEKLPELERGTVGSLTPEQLIEALSEAYARANEPLLQELRELRDEGTTAELAALRREIEELRKFSPSSAEVEEPNPVAVVEPQRREQREWVEETSRRGVGLGVRRATDGGSEDGFLVRFARRLERLLRRR